MTHLRLLRNILSWRLGLSRWLSGQESACQCKRSQRRPGFHPWVGKTPWRREWQPTPVFLPGESHGQRSLVGYSSWGCRVRHDWARACAWSWLSKESQRRVPAIDQEKKSILIVLLGARCDMGPVHHGRLEVEKETLCVGHSWSPSLCFCISGSWGGWQLVQAGWGDDWRLHLLFQWRTDQSIPWLSSWDSGPQEWLSEGPTVRVRSHSTFWPWWSSWPSDLLITALLFSIYQKWNQHHQSHHPGFRFAGSLHPPTSVPKEVLVLGWLPLLSSLPELLLCYLVLAFSSHAQVPNFLSTLPVFYFLGWSQASYVLINHLYPGDTTMTVPSQSFFPWFLKPVSDPSTCPQEVADSDIHHSPSCPFSES